MEYFDMHGVVKLKATADSSTVKDILTQLQAIEFVDNGYFDIERKDDVLLVDAEGLISESHSIKALLTKLQAQLTNESIVIINSVWWETKVLLKVRKPRTTPLFELTPQLALAQ